MKTKMTRSLLLACLGLASLALHAEEIRIGFINPDRIFKETNTYKAAEAKIILDFAKREKELLETTNSFKTSAEKLDRDSPTLSESQKISRQRQLSEQERELQRKRREFQEDLNARKNEEMSLIRDKIQKHINQIAETEKYDLIFQDAVYFSPKVDITDKVIKVINSGK